MNKMIRSACLLLSMLGLVLSPRTGAGQCFVQRYWPMHDGDRADYHGCIGDDYAQFSQNSPGSFTLYSSIDGSTAYFQYQGSELWLTAIEDINFEAPIVLLDDRILDMGGSRTSQSFTYYEGFFIDVAATATVSKLGAVTVPAGTYQNSVNLSLRLTLSIPGVVSKTIVISWVLGPGVGAIKQGIYDSNAGFVCWDQLTDGQVDGVPVALLAATSSLTVPKFVQQPKTTLSTNNSLLVLRASASGGALDYQWFKDNLVLSDDGRIAGATTSNLTIYPVSYADAGLYSVRIANTVCSTYSTQAQISVFADVIPPKVSFQTPLSNSRISNSIVQICGHASDNVKIAQVQIWVAGQEAVIASGTTNWCADLLLQPGTNTFFAQSFDLENNPSPVASNNLIYVVSDRLLVSATGQGTLTPNYSNSVLEVGRGYSMSAVGANGHVFANWMLFTNAELCLISTNSKLDFVMQSNLTVQVFFKDVARPSLTITAPAPGARWSNSLFTVRGKAGDNAQIAQVFYRINTNDWDLAATTNSWTNWTAEVTLTPGSNTIRAYVLDAAGNSSLTNSVTFSYVLSAFLTVNINGKGTVTPNYNGQLLEIGRGYSMSATPAPGYAFTNWSGTLTTNKPALGFLMASNLAFTANFVDVQRPTVAITAPLLNQRWSNEVFTLAGKATDNTQVTQVVYRVNTEAWTEASTTNGWTNWTAEVSLTPGTNTIRAYSLDAAGNCSSTNTVAFFYVVQAPLLVDVIGKGTVNPNYNGQLLEIGRNYTMNGTPSAGYAFTNWSGSFTTNKPALTFLMASNLAFTANFVDVTRPTLAITAPLSGQRCSNELFTVSGKAGDNSQLAQVLFRLNTSDWAEASTTNGWTNWLTTVTLTPGTNTIRAYSKDMTGNCSFTNTVTCFYVVRAPLQVEISGKGTVNPNYNGQLLEIGRNYTMNATPAAGYAFRNWSGSQGTNKAALTFLMASNLAFTANFVDVTRPTVAITAPTPGQRWSNEVFVLNGKTGDNTQVAEVFYQLNTNEWAMASTTNGWTNWSAEITLTPGTNIVRAYAVDATGNKSLTNTVSFSYILTAPIVVQTNGKGVLTPNYNGQLLELGRTYSITATPGLGYVFTNWTGSAITNKSVLTFLMASNLSFTANFLDVQRPTITITAPVAGQRWSNSMFMLAGKAADNGQMGPVFYQLNSDDWAPASTTNAWTNWNAQIALQPGTNTVRAFAHDASGNFSFTNQVSFGPMLTLAASRAISSSSSGSADVSGRGVLLLSLDRATGQLTLKLVGNSGQTYVIQSSTNLVDWREVSTLVPTNGVAQLLQPAPGVRIFFRAMTEK
jgi:hypothetical protein